VAGARASATCKSLNINQAEQLFKKKILALGAGPQELLRTGDTSGNLGLPDRLRPCASLPKQRTPLPSMPKHTGSRPHDAFGSWFNPSGHRLCYRPNFERKKQQRLNHFYKFQVSSAGPCSGSLAQAQRRTRLQNHRQPRRPNKQLQQRKLNGLRTQRITKTTMQHQQEQPTTTFNVKNNNVNNNNTNIQQQTLHDTTETISTTAKQQEQ
jgi:hypothetical protein